MKHIVQHNRVPTRPGPPQDTELLLLLLLRIDGSITEQSEQQGHFFSKRLTVCGPFTADRPLACHHHSLWFMLSCLPRTHQSVLFNFSFRSRGWRDLYHCPCRLRCLPLSSFCRFPLCRASWLLRCLAFSCVRTTAFIF